MVVLSTTLPARVNRITNLVVASVYVVISAGNAIGESWAYYSALAVGLEVTVLALILRYAWTWPRTEIASDHNGNRGPRGCSDPAKRLDNKKCTN